MGREERIERLSKQLLSADTKLVGNRAKIGVTVRFNPECELLPFRAGRGQFGHQGGVPHASIPGARVTVGMLKCDRRQDDHATGLES
jgi:hypothetical protein